MSDQERGGAPRRVLSTLDGVTMVVGLVLGAGIFRAPQVVAAGTPSDSAFLALWVVGGVVSLIGALCYAELAAAYPNAGGEYHFLTRAFGRPAGFLCGWSRMAVIQTGSIAILGFVVGDYAAALFGAGHPVWVPAAFAALVVVGLTALNLLGLRQGTGAQYALTTLEVLGLCAIIAAGLLGPAAAPAETAPAAGGGPGIGLAVVFVLLTFGGWSEAAYLSAEVRDRRRGITRAVCGGVAVITTLYLLANLAYVRGLGLAGVAATPTVAADLMARAVGPGGALVVSAIVMVAALSSANAAVITGARCNFAVGRDLGWLSFLAAWPERRGTPTTGLLLQAAVALVLVAFGAVARSGFEAMVAYTAPVFWLVLLLTGVSLFVLRRRDAATPRPFRVPLYPLTPALFCAAAAFMLYASLAHAGAGALVGVAVMAAGIPVFLFARRRSPPEPPARAVSPDPLSRAQRSL